jgi:hypothetical protein
LSLPVFPPTKTTGCPFHRALYDGWECKLQPAAVTIAATVRPRHVVILNAVKDPRISLLPLSVLAVIPTPSVAAQGRTPHLSLPVFPPTNQPQLDALGITPASSKSSASSLMASATAKSPSASSSARTPSKPTAAGPSTNSAPAAAPRPSS